MLHVGVDSFAESIFSALHEVTSAAAMAMDLDTAWHYIHPLGVEKLSADDSKVAVRNFKNLVVTHQHRAVLEPSLRREYLRINDLS